MWLVENRTSFRYQKAINTERVIIIKRYCQNADFTNLTFIEMCCYEYLDEKWERNDVSNMFATYLKIPLKRVKELQREELMAAIPKIALDIKHRIESGRLRLRPIKYFQKIDGMNGKLRTLGIEEPIHQIMNYVCVNAMKPMLNAKIGIFQCASLPGRGQAYGKKYIERWRNDIRYFVKGDIQKCFPSIPIPKLKELLERDIKNDKGLSNSRMYCWICSKMAYPSGLTYLNTCVITIFPMRITMPPKICLRSGNRSAAGKQTGASGQSRIILHGRFSVDRNI